jgi:hypothetical protein
MIAVSNNVLALMLYKLSGKVMQRDGAFDRRERHLIIARMRESSLSKRLDLMLI